MKKILMNKDVGTILAFIIVSIPFILFLVIYWNILENNATRCENNGGRVVRNEWNRFEKCIYDRK